MEEKVYRTNLLRQILHVGSIAYVGIRKGGDGGVVSIALQITVPSGFTKSSPALIRRIMVSGTS